MMITQNAVSIFQDLPEKIRESKWRVIGISGVDASGKTEFANRCSRYLQTVGVKNAVVHIDDFHNPLAIRARGANEIDAYYDNAFNYKRLITELLMPMKSGSVDKTITCLNIKTDKYDTPIHYRIDADTIVLLEGVLLFRPPLLEYIDGKIFLDITFDTVIERAIARDVPLHGMAIIDKYKHKYIPIQKRYLLEHNPKENCDILIDNNDYDHPKRLR